MAEEIRTGSAPNFCPPVEEGMIISTQDASGEVMNLEFLGLLIKDETRFGFFFPVDEENPALSSGEILVLEVTSLDEDGQPDSFELVEDEAVAIDAYRDFVEATKDLYRFE